MRTLKQLLLVAWIAIAWTDTLAAQDRIPWITNLQAARQMATQQPSHLVLLHFWNENCVPCQRLEHGVFNQPELIRAVSTGFIPVKINTIQSPELASFYRVTSVPTDIVVDASGKEVYRANSPQESNRYIAMLDGVRAHYNVGSRAHGEAIAGQAVGPSPSGNDSRLALDYPPQRTNPLVPSQPAPREQGTWGAGPSAGGPTNMTPNPGLVENPYVNGLSNQNAPRDPGASPAPPYANPYSNSGQAPLPAAPSGNPAPWGASAGGAAANPPRNGDFPVNNYGAPTAPYGQNSPGASSAPPSPAPNSTLSTPPAYGGGSRWDNLPPATNRPWEQDPASSSRPQAGSVPQAPPRASSTANQPPRSAAGHPPLGLEGYCPVTLVSRTRWAKGDPRWGAVHRGRTYLFTTPSEQSQFLSEPDRYSPVLSGYDTVHFADAGQLVEGSREHGVFYRDRIYLFADETSLQRFGTRPDYYIAAAEQANRQASLPNQPR